MGRKVMCKRIYTTSSGSPELGVVGKGCIRTRLDCNVGSKRIYGVGAKAALEVGKDFWL